MSTVLPVFPKEGTRLMNWFALCFVLVMLFPFRFEYSWLFFNTLSPLELMLPVSLGITVVICLIHGKVVVGDRFSFLILSLPVVFGLMSLSFSINTAATVKSILVYSSSLAAFLVTVVLFRSLSFRVLAKVVLAIPVILIVTGILSYVPSSPLRPESVMPLYAFLQDGFLISYNARFSHPFLGLSNSFATVLAMLLPLVLVLRRIEIWPNMSWWVATMILGGLLATVSRGVLFAVFLVYMMVFFWRFLVYGTLHRNGLLLVVLSVVLAFGFLWFNPVAQEHLTDRLSWVNVSARMDAFSAVFSVLKEHPFGVGSGVSLSEVSEIALISVHNAYFQNLLWFGWGGGFLLSGAMFVLPLAVLYMPVSSYQAKQVKKALALSIAILLLINFSQASWEGSVLRVWIYFLVGLGIVMIGRVDKDVQRRAG